MKGIVFTEFIEMAEQRFGPGVVDDVLERSKLPNGGAYTAVGTYDHAELLRMVEQLSSISTIDAGVLVKAFGEHLMTRFFVMYPQFFRGVSSTFEFLPRVEQYIHVEVRKLYPDAELPSFECRQPSAASMEVIYRSARPFANLAEGLMSGCARHFNEHISFERENLAPAEGYAFRFMLSLAH